MIRALFAASAVAATALLLVATSSGSGSAATTLRGTVGPSFTIKLAKNGKAVKSLKAGTYKITVSDRSAEHNFVLARQGGAVRQITSIGFVGTKTVTVTLTKGVWRFFCAPHASVMVGRVAVGGAVLARATTTTTVADDHGNGHEVEPGDDRGGNGEVEAGDDRGGHGEPEPGDDRGGHDG
jgi:plastocyanin